MRLTRLALGILAIVVCLGPNKLYAQPQAIDVNKSSLKIRVFKSGAFSAFAHDHELQAPIDEGKIDSSASPSVQLRVDSRKMTVPILIGGQLVLSYGRKPKCSAQESSEFLLC
jgi:hypothetical protein